MIWGTLFCPQKKIKNKVRFIYVYLFIFIKVISYAVSIAKTAENAALLMEYNNAFALLAIWGRSAKLIACALSIA